MLVVGTRFSGCSVVERLKLTTQCTRHHQYEENYLLSDIVLI